MGQSIWCFIVAGILINLVIKDTSINKQQFLCNQIKTWEYVPKSFIVKMLIHNIVFFNKKSNKYLIYILFYRNV